MIEQVEDYAIFTLDPEGRVSTWNRGAERVQGYLEEEVLGEPSEFTFTSEDRAHGEHERELVAARREGRAADVRWHLHKDGSRFWASGALIALYDRDGKLDGFSKILRDLTRQREARRRMSANSCSPS